VIVRLGKVLERWWSEPVDSASLALFRIAFGGILAWEIARFFYLSRVASYSALSYHFPWAGFAWVVPPPEPWLTVLFATVGVACIGLAAGAFYRVAALVVAIGFTTIFLFDQSYYLNHFYLVCLLSFLMAALPAADEWSVDVWLGRRPRRRVQPGWPLALLRGQLLIVFTFAGLAKLNGDWLCGYPLRQWLAGRSEHAVFGPFADSATLLWTMVYGGLAGDLLFVPAILWRRTRLLGLLAWTTFHLTNAAFFEIGIFPWLMLAATVLLLPPGTFRWRGNGEATAAPAMTPAPPNTSVRLAIAAWLLVQLVLPLRHFAYPGWVDWTEEGHNFAWRMKLRTKSGSAIFHVTDRRGGETWEVRPKEFLSPVQARKLVGRPELARLWAHHLAERWREAGIEGVEVRADLLTSLNGRKPAPLIDPAIDLAATAWSAGAAGWILPLQQARPPCTWAVQPAE
jgi:vitamin K-dependent gamma-carboxylase